jgi:hypothetical protein
MLLGLGILVGFPFFLCGWQSVLSNPQIGVIAPGKAVGPLQLGANKADVIAAFQWRDKPDEMYTHEDPCNYEELHWLDMERHKNGVWAFLRDGRVYQIDVDTDRYSTPDGIRFGATVDQVEKLYRDAKPFRWTHSGSKVNGGRDVFYLINTEKGIAFGFFYNAQLKRRTVESISVFIPGDSFQPDGCLQAPQSLKPVSSLE